VFLPRAAPPAKPEILRLLDQPHYSAVLRLLEEETEPRHLRKKLAEPLADYSDNEIRMAIQVILQGRRAVEGDAEAGEAVTPEEFRRAEYEALSAARSDAELVIRVPALAGYAQIVTEHFSCIALVDKLRETRALVGFTRIHPEDRRGLAERKRSLRKVSAYGRESWLPAYMVHGEGLFIRFEEGRLKEWERRPEIVGRADALSLRSAALNARGRSRRARVSARFVLVHTFAHALMNRLTFDCGYSSASLRERLYVSEEHGREMGGVLVYTAAGDAEGTMGGLVRMGRAGELEAVIRGALEEAAWCSSDPVCIEHAAQGPLSLNMSACHSCTLLPETACEEFNQLLDRALLVPTSRFGDKLSFFKV
jgi:hypothetical protein